MDHQTMAAYGRSGAIISLIGTVISFSAVVDGTQKLVAIIAGLVSICVGVLAGRYYYKATKKMN